MSVFARFTHYFDMVARHRSIRKAAERLNISPSAVDRQICNFEEAIGAKLFERTTKGLRLTTVGQMLITEVRHWQLDFERLKSQIEELKGLKRGKVGIASVQGPSAELIPGVLDLFRRQYPLVTFDITIADPETVARMVLAADADIGLLFNPPSSQGLRIERASKFPLGILLERCHPLAKLAKPKLSDCIAYPVIIPSGTFAARGALDTALARSGLKLDAIVNCNNVAVLKSLIKRGVGVGLLTEIDAWIEIEGGELAFVPLHDLALPPLMLSLCVARGRHLPVAAALMVQWLLRAMQRIEEVRESSKSGTASLSFNRGSPSSNNSGTRSVAVEGDLTANGKGRERRKEANKPTEPGPHSKGRK